MTSKHSRKRTVSLLVIGLCALLVAGCGGGGAGKTEEPVQSGGSTAAES